MQYLTNLSSYDSFEQTSYDDLLQVWFKNYQEIMYTWKNRQKQEVSVRIESNGNQSVIMIITKSTTPYQSSKGDGNETEE